MELGKQGLSTRAGWRTADIGSKQACTVPLSDKNLRAIDEIMRHIGPLQLPLAAIERRHFDHPDLNDDLLRVEEELLDGRGLVVLANLPVDRYGLPDIERIYWGIGAHFGKGHSQSASGDIMGHVENKPDKDGKQSGRGYLSNRELWLHTDFTALVGLACVRDAKRGGESIFVSAEAVYNTILAERPDLMPILIRGFPYHRRGEEAPDAEPITPYDVPVFSAENGFMSVCYTRRIIEPALRDLGRTPTEQEIAALDFFDEVTRRPDHQLRFMLEPGEAAFMNNHTILHARTDFEDWDEPERKRLMLRLWLAPYRRRPVVPEIWLYQNKSGSLGVDPQPGRKPALGKYLVA